MYEMSQNLQKLAFFSEHVFNDRPSPSVTETKLVGEHISTLHAAFIAAESSDNPRRALQKQTWNTRKFYELMAMLIIKETVTLNGEVLQRILG